MKEYRLAYKNIRGTTLACAIDRMFSGTAVSYQDEETAKKAFSEFVELTEAVTDSIDRSFVMGVLFLIDLQAQDLLATKIIGGTRE